MSAEPAATVNPEVSVVIPTYDRPDLLARAVAAALGQEETTVEVIVVDDGPHSPGNTDGLPPDARVTIVKHEQNRGMGPARNTGLSRARAPWVAFLDDDDLWSPTKLRRLIDAAAAGPAGFAYSSAVVVGGDLRPLGWEPAPDPRGLLALLLQQCVMPGGTSNVVARRALLESVGGFDEGLILLGDWDLWIRLAQSADAAAVDEALVAYVHHTRNVSLIGEHDLIRDFRLILRKHGAAARSAGVAFDELDFESYVANRLFKGGRRLRASRRYLAAALRHRSPGLVARALGALVWPTRRSIHGPTTAEPPGWLGA